ncbi:hypothetical protein LTS08_007696 [Lithohypha guttulata]|uniref:uncharacterized protein n=1 Tax=Lithohypha guttulata TaxID=1690604 RepID=UPI002DDE878D|nr:hypothetical protein LTR51_008489 [Lithohypha guttulata]KAK5096440.1 hypothetical protein LTS08_007696 [Lithohypha guttulata]
MSSPIVVIVHTKASSMSAKAEMLEDIHVVVESARNNQTEALKYAVCLPENSADTSIYIFQE